MLKFDILLNEFILLGVEPVASNEMILEAYQHAITEGDVPEEILRNARQTLFKTKVEDAGRAFRASGHSRSSSRINHPFYDNLIFTMQGMSTA